MQQVLAYSPTPTGVAWLATTVASFITAAITAAKLVAVVGVRRLLVAGLAILAVSALLLTRIPAGGHFATDLLPALVLAGVAGGLSAPAAQIGALSGVPHSMSGLASGLVETMREIGGAIGVATVSAALVTRNGATAGHGGPSGAPVSGNERLPRRLLDHIRGLGSGFAHGRDCLSSAGNSNGRTRARPVPRFNQPGTGGRVGLRYCWGPRNTYLRGPQQAQVRTAQGHPCGSKADSQ
jgi:MFS family permease